MKIWLGGESSKSNLVHNHVAQPSHQSLAGQLCCWPWLPYVHLQSHRVYNQLVPFGIWSGGKPTAQLYKGYSYFSLFNCWVFFFPYQVNWMCNAWSQPRRNKKKICFKFFKLMFNKYNKQCKVGEGHLNSYFLKNKNSIRCVMILKVMCVLILCLVLEIETPKSN